MVRGIRHIGFKDILRIYSTLRLGNQTIRLPSSLKIFHLPHYLAGVCF